MSLKNTDSLELIDRYNYLIKEYTDLAIELAPKLEKFGKYRKELQLITVEFIERGVKAEEPEGLRKFVEKELEKRKEKEKESGT